MFSSYIGKKIITFVMRHDMLRGRKSKAGGGGKLIKNHRTIYIPGLKTNKSNTITKIIHERKTLARVLTELSRTLLRKPFLGSGPKGADDLCFHTGRNFLLLLLLLLLLRPPPGFEAQIAASSPNHSLELESQAQGSNSNLMA